MKLPATRLRRFVKGFFDQRERWLLPLAYSPPPVYLLDPDVLGDRARRFRQTFEALLGPCSFYYAMKSNAHPRVVRPLLEAGYGLDVSSGLELRRGLGLGARDLVFSGPGKTAEELALAVEHAGAVTVLLDSFGELHRLEQEGSSRDRSIRAGVRLSTDPSGLWGKFGIPLEFLSPFFREARACPHVDLRGLQFHTSWNLSPKPQETFLAALGKALRSLPPEDQASLTFLDIGGGYWPEAGEWLRDSSSDPFVHQFFPAAPLERFARALAPAIARHLGVLSPLRICFEPGRWICHDALHLVLSVVDRKGPDLVITDGGINAIGWDRFETDYCPILNLSRPSLQERACRIMGSLCTPHDLFGETYFGTNLLPGDILLIPCQGAYTHTLAQHFIKPIPPVVAAPPRNSSRGS